MQFRLTQHLPFPHSLDCFTRRLNLLLRLQSQQRRVQADGLAPYGQPHYTKPSIGICSISSRTQFPAQHGLLQLLPGLTMTNGPVPCALSRPSAAAGSDLQQRHMDLAPESSR